MIRFNRQEILESKKKKKHASSVTTTTGSVGVNIDRFNDAMGNPTNYKDQNGAIDFGFGGHQPDAGMIHMTPVEGSGLGNIDSATGADCGGCGEGGGMGESLEEAKIFAAKVGDYVDIPDEVKLLDGVDVSRIIQRLAPREEIIVGYITPIYFYKKLFGKFTLVKLTQLKGYTGMDARDLANEITNKRGADAMQRAQLQAADPTGHTDYNDIYDKYNKETGGPNISQEDRLYGGRFNTENDRVKSRINGMRKKYGDNEINKTVMQGDQTLYEIDPNTGRRIKDADGNYKVKEVIKDLKTILFVPANNTIPAVRYFIDMKDGDGFFEVDRDNLVDTIYEKVVEITIRDVYDDVITNVEDMNDTEITFLNNVITKVKTVIANDAQTTSETVLSKDGSYKPNFRSLYTNQIFYLDSKDEIIGQPINSIKIASQANEALEESNLVEKRETKRYYIRPQDIFCANKADVLKGLIEVANSGENCTVYSLKNLSDHDDVHKLTNHDIIYYYDDNVLYDKNHVLVMDYDLFIKHEEERKKINKDPDLITKQEYNQNYEDRMTKETVVEAINSSKMSIADFKAALDQGKEVEVGYNRIHKDEIDFVTNGDDTEVYSDTSFVASKDAHNYWLEYTINGDDGVTGDVDAYEFATFFELLTYINHMDWSDGVLNIDLKADNSMQESVSNPFELSFEIYDKFLTEDVDKETKTCVICGEEYKGYGNNAEPYADGYCCDACNLKFVIPARMTYFDSEDEAKADKE